jgi:branched-chain amino acid aminotransferase
MNVINYNGKLLPENATLLNADNRGLRFGDGLFETLKYKNGQFILLDEHLARLWNGMNRLKLQIPKLFTPDYIEQQLNLLIEKNKYQHARLRIMVFRGNGGLYDAENHKPQFIMQCWPLQENTGSWNINGLHCCLYEEIAKTTDVISNCKHNNFLPYVMGALHAQSQQCNDALILNIHQRICDSTIANIFWIKDDMIFTPPLNEGCIAGIIRSQIINTLKNSPWQVNECPLTKELLFDADEVFLTNSIHNMRWVSQIEEKSYTHLATLQIYQYLRQTNPLVFC